MTSSKRTFATWRDAEDAFYESHDCLSDDSDKEQARVERWVESEGHVVLEDNPDAYPEPKDRAATRRRELVRSLQDHGRQSAKRLAVLAIVIVISIAIIIIWT